MWIHADLGSGSDGMGFGAIFYFIPTYLVMMQEGLEQGVQERLVADITSLKKILDTKETNFFFSVLLTGTGTVRRVPGYPYLAKVPLHVPNFLTALFMLHMLSFLAVTLPA